MLVDLMSSNWATICMTAFVKTIPLCETVIVLCVALKSGICIRTLSKLENQTQLSYRQTGPSQGCSDGDDEQ